MILGGRQAETPVLRDEVGQALAYRIDGQFAER